VEGGREGGRREEGGGRREEGTGFLPIPLATLSCHHHAPWKNSMNLFFELTARTKLSTAAPDASSLFLFFLPSLLPSLPPSVHPSFAPSSAGLAFTFIFPF